MSFFRRRATRDALAARLAARTDQARLERLAHTAERRFLTSDIADVPGLMAADPTAVLEVDGRLVGAACFGWRTAPVAWLRVLLLQSEVATADGLRALSMPLYRRLRDEGISMVATTLDEWSEPWLRKPLQQLGYRPMVEVVGYEKNRLDRPPAGSRDVRIRRALPADLQAVLALDRACFPLPWIKGAEIFEPAIRFSPCFIIAELDDAPVGYAFVTAHHGGHLFHLVRIAVAPAYQGRGIGVRLLAEIVDECARQGADLLTLNTQADNYPAQRLYEWFGFVRTGERQTVLGVEIGR